MSHNPPSLARISLLLVGSTLAGMLVSSLLADRLKTGPDKPFPRTEQSLAAEDK